MSVPLDIADLRRAFGSFATGVTVVTSNDNGRAHGMTANSFTSVSLSPPTLLICLAHTTNISRIIDHNNLFGLSILGCEQESLSQHFSSRKSADLEVGFTEHLDVPLIEGALAHFVCRVVNKHEAGDHTIYIGRIAHFRWNEGQPLLFYAGRYQRLGSLEESGERS